MLANRWSLILFLLPTMLAAQQKSDVQQILERLERLEREKGLFSFRESLDNRHECCNIRKVEPLSRALKGLSGWVTGMRREQSPTRTDLKALVARVMAASSGSVAWEGAGPRLPPITLPGAPFV